MTISIPTRNSDSGARTPEPAASKKRASWPYLILIAGMLILGALYHPSVKSAQIDLPLSMPHIREVEITGAEWAVKRRLEAWDRVDFRAERIVRREGRVSVCGETHTEAMGDFERFIAANGGAVLESDNAADFDQMWQATCVNS